MNRCYYDIQEMLEDELKKICKQTTDSLSSQDVEDIYKMVDILKDISTIEAMEQAGFEGYSRDYSNDWPMPRNAYDGGSSYRGRSRDSMGRYSSRGSSYDGYSRHGGKEDMVEQLKESMMNARSEDERENYRRAIEALNR